MSAKSSLRLPLKPVIVILGCTGTGKSKLAISLASLLDGEVISADAMQIYKGLDIITNKVTDNEQSACKHYMIGIVPPIVTNYTVVQFQQQASQHIIDIHTRHKVPVIVGGTNYYIESLLWHTLLTPNGFEEKLKQDKPCYYETAHQEFSLNVQDTQYVPQTSAITDELSQQITADSHTYSSFDGSEICGILPTETDVNNEYQTEKRHQKYAHETSEDLHEMLKTVDPKSAERLHPRNRRKIIRALEVYDQRSETATQLYLNQHADNEALSGGLRFTPCVLYLQADQEVLDKRLDDRVDTMLDQGLINELSAFHEDYNASRISTPQKKRYEEGIFQSIGFKEFHQYLLLPNEDRDTDEGRLLFHQGVESMKRATRRYSRYQQRWVQKRFLTYRGRDIPPVFGLDVTDPLQWQLTVLQPACSIVEAYLKGETIAVSPLPLQETYTNRAECNVCNICNDQVFVTRHDWTIHLASRRHKKRLKTLKCQENQLHHEHVKLSQILDAVIDISQGDN